MVAQDISHEAIIALVHARPELWDSECPGYADRVLKRSKWEEVYRYVTPNWDDMSATGQDNQELSQVFLQEQEQGVQVRHQKMMTLTQVKKTIQRQFHPKIINRSLKNLRQMLIGESGLLPPLVEHAVLSKSHLLRNILIV